MVIFVLATAAPDESLTTPEILPKISCAVMSFAAPMSSNKRAGITLQTADKEVVFHLLAIIMLSSNYAILVIANVTHDSADAEIENDSHKWIKSE